MKQKLFVEGKDFYLIAELCKHHFDLPLGFNKGNAMKFIEGGYGCEETCKLFELELKKEDATNIGIIIDANQVGAKARFDKIKSILNDVFPTQNFDAYQSTPQGISIDLPNLPKIGVWIMPNNKDNGYIEHFANLMVADDDKLMQDAKAKITQLLASDYCRFTAIRSQKAIMHTWLAWQETPGQPFGTAITQKALDAHSSAVAPFIQWLKNVFEFQSTEK